MLLTDLRTVRITEGDQTVTDGAAGILSAFANGGHLLYLPAHYALCVLSYRDKGGLFSTYFPAHPPWMSVIYKKQNNNKNSFKKKNFPDT